MGEQFSGAWRNKSLSHFLQPNPSTSLLSVPQKKLFGFNDLLVKCSGLSRTRWLFMETIKLPSRWLKMVAITHTRNTLTYIIILFVLLLKTVLFIFFTVPQTTWLLTLLPKHYLVLKPNTLHRNSDYTLPFEEECCVILVWTMIQTDSVRSVLHKHVDKPLFQHVSTSQSQTPSSTEVRSTLHMFSICTYTL